MDAIDYSPLGRAVERLNEGLQIMRREPDNAMYRDAVIQRFEFTYGLCVRMLARRLEQSVSEPLQKEMSFPALIRTASENGLLKSGWDVWVEFRKARNLTSHVYNEETAREVLLVIPAFAEEAKFLYQTLIKAA